MRKTTPELLNRLCACCICALTLVALQAEAATITWGPATTISGVSDVSTLGTLDRAFNFVRPDTSTGPFGPATVKGVTFATFGTTPLNPPSFTIGKTTVSAVGTFTADNTGSQSISFDAIEPTGNSAAQINGFQLRAVPTVYTWSTTTTGFAWLNASYWTGNPGHYPGVDANSKSIADGASNDVAAFSSMAFASTLLGINFPLSSNNGESNHSGANG